MKKNGFKRIAIIGLGLIGGSIALGLKKRCRNIFISGCTRSKLTTEIALRKGAIDRIGETPEETVQGSDLVILATPIMEIKTIFHRIKEALSPDTLVTDTGSTKELILNWAQEILPDHICFIGGHPMAGKETPGIKNADPDLFVNRRWLLTPSLTTTKKELQRLKDFIRSLCALPLVLSAGEHDHIVASISHLPILLSNILFSTAIKQPQWSFSQKIASNSFRDTTRLASDNPQLATNIILSNKANILDQISQFEKNVIQVKQLIGQENAQKISKFFCRNLEQREMWKKKWHW